MTYNVFGGTVNSSVRKIALAGLKTPNQKLATFSKTNLNRFSKCVDSRVWWYYWQMVNYVDTWRWLVRSRPGTDERVRPHITRSYNDVVKRHDIPPVGPAGSVDESERVSRSHAVSRHLWCVLCCFRKGLTLFSVVLFNIIASHHDLIPAWHADLLDLTYALLLTVWHWAQTTCLH